MNRLRIFHVLTRIKNFSRLTKVSFCFLKKEVMQADQNLVSISELVRPGMDALGVVRKLFVYHKILFLEFIIYQCEEKPHFAEAKTINPKAKRTVAQALQHTPDFAEPTLVVQNFSDFELIKNRLATLKELDPKTLEIASYLSDDDKKIRVHEAMKVVSRVRTVNGIFHIPILDLDIPVGENGMETAAEVFINLGVKHGAIINSGASYHGWGLELLTDDAWRKFMARALLLDKIDRRWVGHRLIDGQANLRVSEKRGKLPTVEFVF